MNPEYTFKQEGKIYLWKYNIDSNFPGFHMAWANKGQSNFEQLLTLLSKAEVGFYRTLKLSKPTENVLAVPNSKFNQITAVTKLKLEISDCTDWDFIVRNGICHIIMSRERALEFSAVIPQVRSQMELYFEELSFWW